MDASHATKRFDSEALFMFVAEEVFRDLKVDPDENELLRRLARHLGLSGAQALALAREAHRRCSEQPLIPSGRPDGLALYERALRMVQSDGKVEEVELEGLKIIRSVFRITPEQHAQVCACIGCKDPFSPPDATESDKNPAVT